MSRINPRARQMAEAHWAKDKATRAIAIYHDGPLRETIVSIANPPEKRHEGSQRDGLFAEIDDNGQWTTGYRSETHYAYELYRFDGKYAHYRYVGIIKVARVRCLNGHDLTDENIYRASDGYSRCAACKKERARDRHHLIKHSEEHRERRAAYMRRYRAAKTSGKLRGASHDNRQKLRESYMGAAR